MEDLDLVSWPGLREAVPEPGAFVFSTVDEA